MSGESISNIDCRGEGASEWDVPGGGVKIAGSNGSRYENNIRIGGMHAEGVVLDGEWEIAVKNFESACRKKLGCGAVDHFGEGRRAELEKG